MVPEGYRMSSAPILNARRESQQVLGQYTFISMEAQAHMYAYTLNNMYIIADSNLYTCEKSRRILYILPPWKNQLVIIGINGYI